MIGLEGNSVTVDGLTLLPYLTILPYSLVRIRPEALTLLPYSIQCNPITLVRTRAPLWYNMASPIPRWVCLPY